jgi:uncharacterized DUF497 family protein
VEFEWDERKRQSVPRERGIDIRELAAAFFDGRPSLTYPSPRGDEQRLVSVGIFDGKAWAIVWLTRGIKIRIVTARRARDEEEREYRERFPR